MANNTFNPLVSSDVASRRTDKAVHASGGSAVVPRLPLAPLLEPLESTRSAIDQIGNEDSRKMQASIVDTVFPGCSPYSIDSHHKNIIKTKREITVSDSESDGGDIDDDGKEVQIGDLTLLNDFTVDEYFEKFHNLTLIINDDDVAEEEKENQGSSSILILTE